MLRQPPTSRPPISLQSRGPCVSQIGFIAYFWLASIVFSQGLIAQQTPFQEMEKMFEQFAERSGPLGPMFGKLTDEQLKQLDAVEVSVIEERKYGAKVLESYLALLTERKVEVTRAGADVQYLKDLCKALQPQLSKAKRYANLDVRIVEVESTDAYSIPGGHLLLTRGLIDSCGSEAALVGTLAHELSHLEHGHQLLPLKQSKLAQQPLNFADQMFAISLIARPFRPEQETEADQDATEWMMAVGYDPVELARMLNEWHERQQRDVPWMQFIPSMVKTHPNSDRRAAAILEQAQQSRARYPNATYIGRENLKRRVPMQKQKF